MDIRCPYCSKSVPLAPDAIEIECPGCRASFDVEAARLMDESGEAPLDLGPAGGERRVRTEAWLRDEVGPGPRMEHRDEAEAGRQGPMTEGSHVTDAYLRLESDGTRNFEGRYGFTSKDLRYAEEAVFAPVFRKAPQPAEPSEPADVPPRGRPAGQAEAGRPRPPVPSPDTFPPEATVSPTAARPPPKTRVAPLIEDEGPAQVVRREYGQRVTGRTSSRLRHGERSAQPESRDEVQTPPRETVGEDLFGALDAEPAFDGISWVGPEFSKEPPTRPPRQGRPASPSVEGPWPSFSRETSEDLFSDLDLQPDIRVDAGPEGEGLKGDAGTGSLDLSFDDLTLPEPVAGATGPSPDSIDIDSILREESEPELAMPWAGEHAAPAARLTPESEPGAFEGAGGGGSVSDAGLGLPDQWLDLTEGQAEKGVPGSDDLDGLDLEGLTGGSLRSRGIAVVQEVVPAPGALKAPVGVEPLGPARPFHGTAIRPVPRSRRAAIGLRVALLGTFLVILVGVVLGQSEYGYFGVNLFVSSDGLETGRRAVPPPGAAVGIARDTVEAYRNEISRLEGLLREDPDNARVKADLLEMLMRFRERFPAVIAKDEKIERRLKQLEREAQLTGQKASLVRVLDLVNTGQFAEARAVLDGMVVVTAQDADILYFYGKIALGQEKYDEAEKYFELALLKNPALVAAKFFLARTRVAQGNLVGGRKVLDEILTQEPMHLASKVLLAQLALQEKDTETAVRLAREVVLKGDSQAYAGELFDAHLVLAEAARDQTERISELKAALAVRPTHQETAVALARIFLSEGKQDDAISVLEPCWNEGCDSHGYLATYLESALAVGQDQRAMEVMARGKEKYPNSADFHIIHGRHLLNLGRPRAAATAFETAIAAAPGSTEAYLLLAEALSREGKVGEALRQLSVGLERVEDRISILKRMAYLQREMRDFVSAEETLRQALALDPSKLEVHEQLGLVLLALGRNEEAVAVLGALQARHALGREGVLGLARAYLTMNQPGKARDVLAREYSAAQGDPMVATLYGRALAVSGHVQQAEDVLRRVLEERPDFAPAHHAMGEVYVIKGETKQAIDEFVRAVQINPRETRYRLDLARILKKRGGDEAIRDAIAQLDHVLKAYGQGEVPVEEREADAYVLRGEILFGQQKYALAMKDFEAALAMEPARLDILVGFGRTLYEMARYEEAAVYFRQVLARDRSYPEANFYLGRILLRSGDSEGAKALFERVAQRSPDRYPEALRMLGLIYRDQNMKPLARRSFAAYLKYAPQGSAEAEEVRRILERME